jgi:hypothetical protein
MLSELANFVTWIPDSVVLVSNIGVDMSSTIH